jgi:hypothetical protein
VIARQAQHRFAETREHAAEMFVAARIVLHEITRDEDRVAHGEMARSISQRPLEGLESIHSTQRPGDIAEQVRIGELDDSDGTHSNGLYKHAPAWRVIHFTTPSTPRWTG